MGGYYRFEIRIRFLYVTRIRILGFQELLGLPDYVLDMESHPHDYVPMGMDLRTAEE